MCCLYLACLIKSTKKVSLADNVYFQNRGGHSLLETSVTRGGGTKFMTRNQMHLFFLTKCIEISEVIVTIFLHHLLLLLQSARKSQISKGRSTFGTKKSKDHNGD